MIPKQLQVEGIRFVLVEKKGKRPFQEKWQEKIISFSNPELVNHLSEQGNYGVIGGGLKNLLIVDFDTPQIEKEVSPKLPETFTVKTGRGLTHRYYFSDGTQSFKIFNEEMDTLIDVQGEGKQALAPGSIHPNGNKYEVLEDKEIAFIPYSELKAIIMAYDRKPKKQTPIAELEKPIEYSHDDFLEIIKHRVRIEDVLKEFGVDTSRNPSNCPFHNSKGGKCLGWKDEVAHCFHCEGSWNVFSLVKDYKKYDFKQALAWITDKFNLQKEHEQSRKQYLSYLNSSESNEKKELKNRFLELVSGEKKKISEATELIVDYIKKKNYIYSTKDDLRSEMWIYNKGIYVPQGKSQIKIIMREVLEEFFSSYFYNQVIAKIEADTFIESDSFFSASYPYEIPVQNGILNILSRNLLPFTHEKIFFNKLPCTYVPALKCPAIDAFLNDVLAKEEDKLIFYELAGFALMKEYKYEKAAMFVGNGRNGKGKSLELLKRLVGIENCSSIPLSGLMPDSFNISELFGKLLNLAGDIGNKDLEDTSMFKSLTGRDLVTTKRKFLTGLNFENYAKFIFACNELPAVYDTTRGFWDRWVLLEFPYTFVTKEELIKSQDKTNLKIKDEDIISRLITPEELSGLLNAALDGLDRLRANHNFSTTSGSKEIKELWVRKSNSVVAFVFDKIEGDADDKISKKDFRKRYSEYCKLHGIPNKSDYVIKKALQEMYGATDERVTVGSWPDNISSWYWIGVKWKL